MVASLAIALLAHSVALVPQQPSHLQKWKRVTLTFEYEVSKPGYDITRIEAFAAKAPETGTQMNCSTEVSIKPNRTGLTIPATSLEAKEETFKSSEGKQTGIFTQYRNKEKQTYQGGYIVTVHYRADLYHYVSLPNSTVTTVQGKYPPTSLANYSHPVVMDWGNRFIGSTSAPDPAFACAGSVIKAIRDAGVKYSGEENVKSASELLAKKSGDCGSVTTLFEAGVLGSGYNARMLVG